MLKNKLECRAPELVDGVYDKTKIITNDKASSFNVIYYNSWDTDFSDDALLPLINSIVELPEFKPVRFNDAGKKALKKFKDSAVAVAKAAGYALLHHALGETATQTAKAVDEAISKKEEDPLKKYNDKLKLLECFKTNLKNVIEKTKQKRLVIIIDELDRCRPTFAIQTLEIAKHLFNIPGLMFIFALDIKQLSCSVETIYGKEMDAPGYLCRFFDYIGKITVPDEKRFISQLFENGNCFKKYPYPNTESEIEDYIYTVSSIYKFSLRDISTVFQTYMLMYEYFLHSYQLIEAQKLYISLLIVKYKDMDLYNRLRKTKDINRIRLGDVFYTDEQKELLSSCDSLGNAVSGCSMMNMDFDFNLNGEQESNAKMNIIAVDTNIFEGHLKVVYEFDANRRRVQHALQLDDRGSFNNILFIPDLQKWDRIKQLTPIEYLYNQLEMFNFAFPADETPPEA